VLLASQLINTGDRQRAAFLATCARHVAPDGVVLIQRYDPAWGADPRPSASEHGDLRMRVIDPRRDGRHLTATVEYEIGGRRWQHGPFTSTIVDDAELEARLAANGLYLDRWLDDRRSWLAARRLPDESALYVEVPSAEPLVGELRLAYDSTAAAGIPAHVTVLYPFLEPRAIDDAVERDLGQIAGGMEPFDLVLGRTGRFPTVLWLAPEPAAPFIALTDAVTARWPDHPPYGGSYDEVIHHLTVADSASDGVLAELERTVAAGLPLRDRVTDLTLAVRESGTWSRRARFPLGRP
jgi:hypothetical protein